MDWFQVDIILLVVLCFLTVFLCAYGVYCVYRVLVSLQMQTLLRPTRVLFSHKKEGQSREELRTVVAYRNPFTGDYCVNKSRSGVRGYLNTTPSPDSGLSDEYEPLHQPALARGHVEPGNQLGGEPAYSQSQNAELEYRQLTDPSYTQGHRVDPAYSQRQHAEPTYSQRQNAEPSYSYEQSHNVDPAYSQRQNIDPSYKKGHRFEKSYSQSTEPAYSQRVEPVYKKGVESDYRSSLEPVYHRHLKSGMTNMRYSTNEQTEPTHPIELQCPQHDKSALMMTTEQIETGVKLASTRSLNTSQPLRLGWVTHLKSALRKPCHHLKTSSMPSVEDNVLNKTWNWNYKEYQI